MKNIVNKKEIIPALTSALIGVIFGLIYIFIISKVDKINLTANISSYISDIKINNILSEITRNTLSIALITVFSVVIPLSPLALLITFYKGIKIGFLVSSLIYTYRLKSIKYLLILLPKEILLIAIMIIYTTISLKFTNNLIMLIKNRKSLDIRLYFKRISLLFVIFSIAVSTVILISTLISTFLISKI